jgi:hypothetical protein
MQESWDIYVSPKIISEIAVQTFLRVDGDETCSWGRISMFMSTGT